MQAVASAAQSGLAFLRQYHQEYPLDLDDDQFMRLHERFLRELSKIDTIRGHLNDTDCATYGTTCSRCHKRYLAIKEAQANKNLLAAVRNGGASGEILSGLARSAYPPTAGRMAINSAFKPSSSLGTLLDFRDCKNVVMVGSGSFPITLLWLRENFPMLRCVGLDIDPDCVNMATELVTALGVNNIHFETIDGRDYDYSGADFVYVANYVVPKRAVLEQIARNGSVRWVLVREPTRGGELLAEAVRFDLPSVFIAEAAGAESGIMMYDLLLRRV
jgi:hypothetical protein